ncbi:MAG: hypothetical protein ACT4TC_01295 [Myxococcaceae bacterium]
MSLRSDQMGLTIVHGPTREQFQKAMDLSDALPEELRVPVRIEQKI